MPFEPRYEGRDAYPSAVGESLYDPVRAAKFPALHLRYRNDEAARSVGLAALSEAEWEAHFACFQPLPNSLPTPLALRYHGHQFQHYNPDLGDGRGFLFAQVAEVEGGRLLDLTTKGSGTTPWSRGGDGRLTLQGAVREVLAAEMLETLGVPTCRILSVFETGERLTRHDEPSPTRSGVMVRLQHSSVRYGTFQRLAYHRDEATMKRLLDWCCGELYSDLASAQDQPAALLGRVRQAAANTLGAWMAAGFVHGVLNTDNMNITGESFDYGPFRFLPWLDPSFTAAYFDYAGLYAFGRQSSAVFWNLQQLAHALALVGDRRTLLTALDGFERDTQDAWRKAFLRRLGVLSVDPFSDHELLDTASQVLRVGRFPLDRFFYDWFGGGEAAVRADDSRFGRLYRSAWFAPLRHLLLERAATEPASLEDPYFAEDAPIGMTDPVTVGAWAPIHQDDDWHKLESLLGRVRRLGLLMGTRSLPTVPDGGGPVAGTSAR